MDYANHPMAEKIIRLNGQGYSYREIGTMAGVSAATVTRVLRVATFGPEAQAKDEHPGSIIGDGVQVPSELPSKSAKTVDPPNPERIDWDWVATDPEIGKLCKAAGIPQQEPGFDPVLASSQLNRIVNEVAAVYHGAWRETLKELLRARAETPLSVAVGNASAGREEAVLMERLTDAITASGGRRPEDRIPLIRDLLSLAEVPAKLRALVEKKRDLLARLDAAAEEDELDREMAALGRKEEP